MSAIAERLALLESDYAARLVDFSAYQLSELERVSRTLLYQERERLLSRIAEIDAAIGPEVQP